MLMREPLTIAVAQPLCQPFDVAVNAVAHAAFRAARARVVVVFPELSLTGYEMDAPSIAVEDPRLTPTLEPAPKPGAVALVGAPVQGEAGRSHIAMLAVDGTGATVAYRKLWVDSTESDRFAPEQRAGGAGGRRQRGWILAVCGDAASSPARVRHRRPGYGRLRRRHPDVQPTRQPSRMSARAPHRGRPPGLGRAGQLSPDSARRRLRPGGRVARTLDKPLARRRAGRTSLGRHRQRDAHLERQRVWAVCPMNRRRKWAFCPKSERVVDIRLARN